MDVSLLLSRVSAVREPVFTGEWATLLFRPDLGSQQEFVVGVSAAVNGDQRPIFRWLPVFTKLSGLYGEALHGGDVKDLLRGAEAAVNVSFRGTLRDATTGTPHVRLVTCGYLATDHIESELIKLLKRHAGALWADAISREPAMDDDWAYAEMRRAIRTVGATAFVPNREISLGDRKIHVGLDNGKSFGNIVSARYSSILTVERHVYKSLKDVVVAHRLTNRRSGAPALFVVLPVPDTAVDAAIYRKTGELLSEVRDMGVLSFADAKPDVLAAQLETWLA